MPIIPMTFCHEGNIGLPCFELTPTTVTCPFCRNRVTTRVLPIHEPLTKCDACCYSFCCYGRLETNDVKHVCPVCNKKLGTYRFAQPMTYIHSMPIVYSEGIVPGIPMIIHI